MKQLPERKWLHVEPPTVPDLASRLRSWRLRRHLTQQQLGERISMSRTLISRYEERVVYPELRNIQKLVSGLDISMNDLLEPDPIMRELMRKRLHPDVRAKLLETVRCKIEANG